MKFSINDFVTDLVTFIEKIFNGKLQFLCNAGKICNPEHHFSNNFYYVGFRLSKFSLLPLRSEISTLVIKLVINYLSMILVIKPIN